MNFQSYPVALAAAFPVALAAAFALAIPVAASAADVAETNTVGVKYKDLDLASETGKAELERRLDRAARGVCGMGDKRTGTRITDRESRQCYREARVQLDRQFAAVVERQTAIGG